MSIVLSNRYPIESLPEDVRPPLPAGTHVRVVIEPALTDEAILAEFDRKIDEGLRSIGEGRLVDIDEVERRLLDGSDPLVDAAE